MKCFVSVQNSGYLITSFMLRFVQYEFKQDPHFIRSTGLLSLNFSVPFPSVGFPCTLTVKKLVVCLHYILLFCLCAIV